MVPAAGAREPPRGERFRWNGANCVRVGLHGPLQVCLQRVASQGSVDDDNSPTRSSTSSSRSCGSTAADYDNVWRRRPGPRDQPRLGARDAWGIECVRSLTEATVGVAIES
jgi:hypothetical protein